MVASMHAVCPDSSLVPQEQAHPGPDGLRAHQRGCGVEQCGEDFRSAFEAFRIKEFRQIAGATFLIFNSFNVIVAFTFLIIVHYMFNSDPASAGTWPAMHGSVGALITTFLVIPVVMMSKKLGKKKAFMVSQFISIVGYVLFWFSSSQASLTCSCLRCRSTRLGLSLFTIMMSMTADVCDLDELERASAVKVYLAPCTGGWSSWALAWRPC